MTRTGYIFAKTCSIFGITQLEKYRTSAAFEAHLLRDSETVIGELVWEELEKVEEISTEYWKLRKLSKKGSELDKEIERLTDLLETAQDSRARALEEVAVVTKGKVQEREKASESVDRLLQEREDIQKDGRSIKRSHSGLKTKLEVLLEEEDDEKNPIIIATRKELQLKRTQFEAIKERRDTIDARIAELQKKLSDLNKAIEIENDSIRNKAEQQFGTIGKTNKELTTLRSSLGQIQNSKSELHVEIGRFVLQNTDKTEIRHAARKYRGLLSLIDEVRASSNRHRKLIGH